MIYRFIHKYHIYGLLMALGAVACTDTLVEEQSPTTDGEGTGQKVLMVAGAANDVTTTTRATTIPYMGDGGRFVCRMYYMGEQNSEHYDTYNTAWLRVDGTQSGATTTTKRGNSLYWNSQYTASGNVDIYGFDKNAACFYWQNRKNHAFLAITDLHRAYRSDFIGGTTPGTLKMEDAHPDYTLDVKNNDQTVTSYKANAYDLRHWKWTKVNDQMVKDQSPVCSSFADQPDIAQARTIKLPGGATPEANRVDLVFKHCFAQVQVNVQKSPDGSVADLEAQNIEKVELLGVSETGYVYYELDKDGNVHAPTYAPVQARNYTAEWWSDNPYGTAMETYQMNETASGALKSFNCIAFGVLRAIRIHWRENDQDGTEHVATREVEDKYRTLMSGTKYVFNVAMRRGTLAVLQADVIKWDTFGTQYSDKGIIDEDQSDGNQSTE